MLFRSNIKKKKAKLDYDARAFRYSNDGAGVITTYPHGILPDEQDDINPEQDPFSSTPSLKYLYQTDGVTLGGTGANVRYKFVTRNDIVIDNRTIAGGSTLYNPPYQIPELGSVTNTLNGNSYPAIDTYHHSGSAYYAGLFRNFQRDETYRFAVEFYDLNGNPLEPNWIGDIRFPHMFMPTPGTNTFSNTPIFPITSVD